MSFFTKEELEVSVVIDIGSSSLGIALVHFIKGNSPEILYSKRTPIVIPETPHSQQLKNNILSIFKDELDSLSVKVRSLGAPFKVRKVDHVYCFYSSLWYEAFLHKVLIKEQRPIKLSRQFISDLVKTEEKKLIRKYAEKNKLDTDQVCALESRILKGSISGYNISNFIDKEVKNAEFSVAITLANYEIVSQIEKIIHKSFHTRKYSRNTSLTSLYSLLLDLYPNIKNFMWFNVSGESTEAVRVEDEVLSNRQVIPFGRNLLLRSVSKNFNVPISVAESYLNLYFGEKGNENFNAKISEVLKNVVAEWNIYLSQSLEEIFKQQPPSSSVVFLFTENTYADFFEKSLLSLEYNSISLKYEVLLADEISAYFRMKKGIKLDDFIVFHSIFIHKMLNY